LANAQKAYYGSNRKTASKLRNICRNIDSKTITWYNSTMTSKEIALQTIEQLPEDASWEDIQERINFVAGVRKGLRELDEGKGVPHDKVREEFAEWLTD
jgi:predicted transcriptional regulator